LGKQSGIRLALKKIQTMNQALNYTGRFFMFLFSIAISLFAMSYFNFSTQGNLLSQKDAELLGSILYRSIFYLHIAGGIVALFTGAFQFLPKFRKKRIKLHRTLGKAYLLGILVGGSAGFIIAWFAQEGWGAKIGFVFLALAWLYTSWQAYSHIRKRQIVEHQKWMHRSYAVTFSAVTLRIWLPLFLAGFGWEFSFAYPIVAWLCWVPNLMVMEWALFRRFGKVQVKSERIEAVSG